MIQENQVLVSQTREQNHARYVYCIGQFNGKQINCFGIEGNPIRIVKMEELCALVHDCKPKPYVTKNPEKAKKWIIQHQAVVDKAMQEMKVVIPFSFDIIFKEENQLMEFLKLNKEKIKEKLKQLEGKREFGIKIFYNENLQEQIARKKTKQFKEIEKESKGKAYFLRKKIEREISVELQFKLNKYFEKFYQKISIYGKVLTEDVKEKNMLAKFSCLVPTKKIKELSKILDEINKLEDFTIIFTGPWPPYSFAHKLFEEKNVAC